MGRSVGGLVFDLIKVPFVVASPFVVADRVGDAARSGWDPHYGDPDGESIVWLAQLLSGTSTFLAALVLVLVVEFVRRRWRNGAAGHAANPTDHVALGDSR